MTVEIPSDVQPFVENAVSNRVYASEQEAVSAILRVAASSLHVGHPLLAFRRRTSMRAKKSSSAFKATRDSANSLDMESVTGQAFDQGNW